MTISYDLSKENVREFEKENLIYTIDEMLAMDNEKRWAELTIITYHQSWLNDTKKTTTARALMLLIELEKGYLETQMGIRMSFFEQYLIVEMMKKGATAKEVASRFHRSPNALRILARKNNIPSHSNARPITIETRDGQRFDVESCRKASKTKYCDVPVAKLQRQLNEHGKYSNDKATFYYKDDEQKLQNG